MTPHQQHADAVEAAREWRDEQRERFALTLPAVGDLITIRWPNAEHDFIMRYLREDLRMMGAPDGWLFLHGQIVEPASWHGRQRSFMVHRVDDEWAMLPKHGKLSDVRPQGSENHR